MFSCSTHYPLSSKFSLQMLFLPTTCLNIYPRKSLSFLVALKPFFSPVCRRKKMLYTFANVNTSVALGAGGGAKITAGSCHIC